jgi:hypothetical protein
MAALVKQAGGVGDRCLLVARHVVHIAGLHATWVGRISIRNHTTRSFRSFEESEITSAKRFSSRWRNVLPKLGPTALELNPTGQVGLTSSCGDVFPSCVREDQREHAVRFVCSSSRVDSSREWVDENLWTELNIDPSKKRASDSPRPFTKKSFQTHRSEIMRKVFSVAQFETKTRKFADEVKTNGYAVSATMIRPLMTTFVVTIVKRARSAPPLGLLPAAEALRTNGPRGLRARAVRGTAKASERRVIDKELTGCVDVAIGDKVKDLQRQEGHEVLEALSVIPQFSSMERLMERPPSSTRKRPPETPATPRAKWRPDPSIQSRPCATLPRLSSLHHAPRATARTPAPRVGRQARLFLLEERVELCCFLSGCVFYSSASSITHTKIGSGALRVLGFTPPI